MFSHAQFSNEAGVPFTVVYIPRGEAGPNPKRVPAGTDKGPTIEFYDARHTVGESFHPVFGQFTGGYYRTSTLPEAGAGLRIGADGWYADAAMMTAVWAWITSGANTCA
jgi:hypothetical protein